VLDEILHDNVVETVLPGVLGHYDLDDLILATAPRPVLLIDPVDAEAHSIRKDSLASQYKRVFTAEDKLHASGRVRFVSRSTGEASQFP
jgi:hypothetical protein